MKDKKLLIHIGMPKCGTTTLQRAIFPNFHPTIPVMKSVKLKEIPYILNSDGNIIISEENLVEFPLSGTYHSNQKPLLEQFESNIDTLADLFPHAEIMIGFRKHSSFLKSAYKQYLYGGGKYGLNTFCEYFSNFIFSYCNQPYLTRLEIINKYFEHPPYVYILDDLKDNLEVFINSLEQITDSEFDWGYTSYLKQNVGVGKFQAFLMLLSNRYLSKKKRKKFNNGVHTYLNSVFFKDLHLPDNLKEEIDQQFEKDWNIIKTKDNLVKKN